jgi:hypothetical protein
MRPVYHRKEDRIRAHVLLSFLALLLCRVAETRAHDTWPNLRRELERIRIGDFHGSAGRAQQRTETTLRQREILTALDVPEPPRFLAIELTTRVGTTPPRPTGGNPRRDGPHTHVELQTVELRFRVRAGRSRRGVPPDLLPAVSSHGALYRGNPGD